MINSCDTQSNTIIPRPTTKRQHSSPAGYGLTKINLSEAVAKIINGPHSCTNPFLNGSESIAEDEDTNDHIVDNLTNLRNAQFIIDDEKPFKNPFIQKIEEFRIFSYPDNVHNVDNGNSILTQTSTSATTPSPRTIDFINVSSEECALIQLDYVDTSDKYSDSICADAFESISNPYQKQFRNRSLSAIDANNIDDENLTCTQLNEQTTTNPFVGGNLHKTVSDTQLKQMTMNLNRNSLQQKQQQPQQQQQNQQNQQQTWSFGRSLGRQSNISEISSRPVLVSQTSISGETTENVDLKRAMSCDSVNSDSSVLLADLEQQQCTPSVTGQLCIGLQYDK